LSEQIRTISRQRSLEQQRAAKAWECVSSVKTSNYASKYGSLARSAPADIQANGLGQTLAFWRAKGYQKGKPGNNEHSRLLLDVSEWVGGRLNVGEKNELLEWICKDADVSGFRHATTEAIAFLSWVKRFAEAELIEAKGA